MINLITDKEVGKLWDKNIQSKDDYFLAQFYKALETKVQQACHQLFNDLGFEYEQKFGKKVTEFVQFDNGGRMGFAQHKKKKAEGTKAGIPDCGLFLGSPCGQYSKLILVEFKRIGSPSQIKISPEQKHYHDWFNSIGFKSYITNNPLFFRDVILGEVKAFFNQYSKNENN